MKLVSRNSLPIWWAILCKFPWMKTQSKENTIFKVFSFPLLMNNFNIRLKFSKITLHEEEAFEIYEAHSLSVHFYVWLFSSDGACLTWIQLINKLPASNLSRSISLWMSSVLLSHIFIFSKKCMRELMVNLNCL